MRILRNAGLVACASLGAHAAVCFAAIRPSGSCPPRHSRTLASDRQAAVYVGPNSEGEYEVFGCARGAPHPYVFGIVSGYTSSGGGGVEGEVLDGVIAAYDKGGVMEGTAGIPRRSVFHLIVRDLRTGRVLHRVPTGPPAEPGDIGHGRAVAMVVKRDGAVAWFTARGGHRGELELELHALDRTGSRMLAEGPNIDPHSLRLRGSVLSWTQDGRPFSATLR